MIPVELGLNGHVQMGGNEQQAVNLGVRHQGKCKWFNATKGFGFITPARRADKLEGGADGDAEAEDLFVHQVRHRLAYALHL